jgi:hypothetical protein
VAIVTPSYGPDSILCDELNRSVQEFFPTASHYILVDHLDLPAFRKLEGGRTHVIVKEEILPGRFKRLPGFNRWMCRWTPRPMGGWLVQQIAKLASANHLQEQVLVLVDSDTCFVRDVDQSTFVRDGATRLFRRHDGIRPDMKTHVLWHQNCCRLLGVAPDQAPMPDYISSLVSWDRRVVLRLQEHIESVTGHPWQAAIARTPQVSEFLLYGLLVDKVGDGRGQVWIDDEDRCLAYWDFTPLPLDDVGQFAAQFADGDIALLMSSVSGTAADVRRAMRLQLTGGRLN